MSMSVVELLPGEDAHAPVPSCQHGVVSGAAVPRGGEGEGGNEREKILWSGCKWIDLTARLDLSRGQC